MRITVLLFANLAETLGADRLTLELPDEATVADALDSLGEKHPPINLLRDSLAVAINESYGTKNAKLRNHDTLALIPPVSGG